MRSTARPARYVSRQRLEAMLEHEFVKLRDGLEPVRGDAKCFFAFADTVATGGYRHPGPGRGWLGVRFQTRPHEEPSEVIVHAHLRDSTAARQQEALGVLGVNLIYGAFYRRKDPADLIASLMDELSRERVEIDMIKFSGPAFPGIDNRLMSLQLVERGLDRRGHVHGQRRSRAAVGSASQEADPGGAGQFPAGHQARRSTCSTGRGSSSSRSRACAGNSRVVLAEMTLRSLDPEPDVGHPDFLARADVLRALGFDVLVSRFGPYYQLVEYLAGYTDGLIGLAVGLPAFRQVADEKYFTDLPGGVLESVGPAVQALGEDVCVSHPRSGHRRNSIAGTGSRSSPPGTTCGLCCSRSAVSNRFAVTTSLTCRFARPTFWPESRGATSLGGDGAGRRRGDHQGREPFRLETGAANPNEVRGWLRNGAGL